MKIDTGNFKGATVFWNSGIERIENLHIQTPNSEGIYSKFKDCPNLKTLEGWDLSKQIEIEPKKLEAEIKRRAALQKFHTNKPNQKNSHFYEHYFPSEKKRAESYLQNHRVRLLRISPSLSSQTPNLKTEHHQID